MPNDRIKVNRAELDAVFKNPRLVRAIEELINMTQDLLPDQVAALTLAIEETAYTATSAQAAANANESLLRRLEDAVSRLEVAPVVQEQLPARDDPSGRLEALEARVHTLAVDIDGLKQGLTP